MKRKDVPAKYRWKLEDMFISDDDWESKFAAFNSEYKKVSEYKGKLGDKKALKECLVLSDKIDLALERLYAYSHMRRDEDGTNSNYCAMADRIDTAATKYASEASFISPELCSLDEKYLKNLADDADFKDYDIMLKQLLRRKKYILSEKEEKLLAMSGNAMGTFKDIFGKIDYIDLGLPKIKDGDKYVQLTQGKYSMFMQSPDRALRKKAFNGLYKSYVKLINTITSTYAGSVKSDNYFAFARGYESCLSKELYRDEIPTGVYDNLLEAVSGGLSSLHQYMGYRKKTLGVDELHMYDVYVPLVENAEKEIAYEDAFKIVKEGLKPLGDEYAKLLDRAYNEGWIDVLENENKRSGAYSWGAYGTHPFVLLNHSSTMHDMFTIAHELGHAMHSYYSDGALPHMKAQYAIFVAEVASTVNEVLLLKYLLNKAEDKKTKKYLLNYYLEMFRTTLFRQTMFAEFEKISHDMEAAGKPLTPETLSSEYYALNKKYYGNEVVHDDYIKYEWARIPHFYNAFYVYKYATGITSAVNIAKGILSGDGQKLADYKRFLKSGGNGSPYEILKITGVDLNTKAPYEVAMKDFYDTLEQLKQL